MPDVLQSEFEVEVDGDRYTFRAPSIRYRFEVGGRSAAIRQKASPEGFINERNGVIDWAADNLSRSAAVLELYLVRATTPWPFGAATVAEIDWNSAPKVDFEKIPPGKEDAIEAVAAAFSAGLARFRDGGDINKQSVGT